MASYTTNLNLKKPALTDGASIADINGNMDAIDAGVALKTQAIKNITRNGTTFTATRCDNTTFTFTQQDNDHYAWSDITGKPSYYDGAAIKNITRSGTTFTATKMDGTTFTFTQQDNDHYAWSDITSKPATATRWPAWSEVTSKPSYYDGAAIKNITRSGTTFTATKMDGTTFTFTQQDNNTTYSAGTDMSLSSTTFNHANSGVVAGTYGPSTNVTGDNGNTITVPQIAVNARGHVTGVNTRTYTSVNTWRPVENSLTSTSTTASLTAAQGKALNDKMAFSSGNGTRNTTYTSSGSCTYAKQRCGDHYIVTVSLDCYSVAGKSSDNVAVYFSNLPVPASYGAPLVLMVGASQSYGNFCTIYIDGSGNLRPWYCGTTLASHVIGTITYIS